MPETLSPSDIIWRVAATNSDALNSDPSNYFSEAYQDVMYTGVIGFYSRLVHRLMDRPFRGQRTPVVLEVGAGAGQHAPYTSTTFDTYYQTDANADLIDQQHSADDRIIPLVANAEDLSGFDTHSVDRLVATCLLAHLDRPEQALQEWRRVVRPGGSISVYLPAEPGILLRFLRHAAVAPKSKRFGQDHLSIVYRDHRNHYPGMRQMIRLAFPEDEIRRRRFPTRWLGWNFSLFEIVHIVVKRDVSKAGTLISHNPEGAQQPLNYRE